MKLKTIFYSLCIATLVFACETNDLEPLEDINAISDADAFARGIGNAPGQSGVFVLRGEDYAAWVIVDSKTGLTTINGFDGMALFCNGEFLPDIVPIQLVFLPNNDFRAIVLEQGEIYTEVFDGAWDFENDDGCDFLTNAQLLAEGPTQFILTDNDAFGDPNSNNANAYGVNIHGRLTTPDDKMKSLNTSLRFLWHKDDIIISPFDIQVSVSVQLH